MTQDTPAAPTVESVWMFKGRDGKWYTFIDEKHRQNTILSGDWDVREFQAATSAAGGATGDLVRLGMAEKVGTEFEQFSFTSDGMGLPEGTYALYAKSAALAAQSPDSGAGPAKDHSDILARYPLSAPALLRSIELKDARIAELVAANEMLSRSLDESLFCNVQGIAERLAAQPQPPAAPLTDAEIVLAALDSGEWELKRNQPHSSFTDKTNKAHAWTVQRNVAPHSTDDGRHVWTGETALTAMRKAAVDLGITLPGITTHKDAP